MKALLDLFLLIFFAAGCSTIKPYNGFVGSIDMSSLGTFEYRYTQIRENDFSDRQKSILRELSGPVITKALIVSAAFKKWCNRGGLKVAYSYHFLALILN